MALITFHWHCLISQLHPATYFVGKSKRWVKLEGFCPKTGSGRGLVFLLKKWERVFLLKKCERVDLRGRAIDPPGLAALSGGSRLDARTVRLSYSKCAHHWHYPYLKLTMAFGSWHLLSNVHMKTECLKTKHLLHVWKAGSSRIKYDILSGQLFVLANLILV